MQPPKTQKPKRDCYDEEQTRILVDNLEKLTGNDIKYRVAILLDIFTGARLGELVGLEWSDIDFNNGIININKSDVAGKIILNIPVKTSTGRAISMVRPEYRTSYALVRYIAVRPFAKSVSSSIDSNSKESILQTIFERIKEFFYS